MDKSYQELREEMVDKQIVGRGITDQNVLTALRSVPRHLFVTENLRELAYIDRPLPIDCQQTISQPYMVALMTESLEITKDSKVLEIGTGSGYQAAVLAEICSTVYTIEKFPDLLKKTAALLQKLGYHNIIAKSGDGTLGWPEHQPFDAILVTAGSPRVPEPLLDQLADGGRLLIPVGSDVSQDLKKITRLSGRFIEKRLGGCQFVPLRGKYGWN
jgi:protein-L-isoaspartate(D-aspartate) O-methyltransferase